MALEMGTPYSIIYLWPHRKNHQRQLEALQQTVEEETRGKAEQTRQKKAMEEQLNELQSSIDDAQKVDTMLLTLCGITSSCPPCYKGCQ